MDSILIVAIIIGLIRSIDSSNINTSEEVNTNDNEVCVDDNCDVEESIKTHKWFEYTYNRFKVYNRDIDSSTVELFLDVAEHYGFADDSTQYRLVVGQILLESGANQYYFKGHPYEGRLVLSPVGAVGMTQIMPTTAYHFMDRVINEKDREVFKKFGADEFKFIDNEFLTKNEKVELARKWLTNKENNIIMWGYIMRHNMTKTGNLVKSLIAYNAGRGGLNIYMKNGNSIWNHDYVKGIYNRLYKVDKKVAV